MYLYKEIYVGAEYEHREISGKIEIYEKGNLLKIDLSKVSVIRESVMYWRKANPIHNWFVTNIQNGEDDCKEYYVTETQLQELITTCKEVLDNPESAKILLPPMEGFFFGYTDIDSHYMDMLRSTVTDLEQVLKNNEDSSFIYRADW